MKKLFFYLGALVLLFTQCTSSSQTANENKFTLNAEVGGEDSTWVFLQHRGDDGWEKLDSNQIKDGKFSFTKAIESPEMFYITVKGKKNRFSFFGENGVITLKANMDSTDKFDVSGSEINSAYNQFNDSVDYFENQMAELYPKYQEAQKNQDPALIKQIEMDYEKIYNGEDEFMKNYVWKNNKSFLSPYILIHRLAYSLDYNKLDSFYQNFDHSLSTSIYYQQTEKRLKVLKKVAVGQIAPDFELPDSTGKMIKLSSFRGKYLLIDFWASWCGPCRRENPNNVALYKDFKDKGFEILGVSFDEKRENWLKAIESDGLTWTHVSDLKGWNCAAGKLYGVRSIPHTVLLNPEGKIIAKNLRGEELRKKVEELL